MIIFVVSLRASEVGCFWAADGMGGRKHEGGLLRKTKKKKKRRKEERGEGDIGSGWRPRLKEKG